MGLWFLAPILVGLGGAVLSGCAGSRERGVAPKTPSGDSPEATPVTVDITPPGPAPDVFEKAPPPEPEELRPYVPPVSLSWRILQLEQKLLELRCSDGQPSISRQDLAVFRGTPAFQGLAELYGRFQEENSIPLPAQSFMRNYVFLGALNHQQVLAEIIQTAPQDIQPHLISNPLSLRTNLHWGSFLFVGEDPLDLPQLEGLREYILAEFREGDVNFLGELVISQTTLPTQSLLYGFEFHFIYPLQCPRII